MRLATGTGTAGLGSVVRVVAQVPQGRHAGVDDEHDRSARAAVPTVGSAAWHVRLASERGRAVATSTTGHEDPNLVSEHR
jgi:hypothetical protein